MNELLNITNIVNLSLSFYNIQKDLNSWLDNNYKILSFETITNNNNISYLIVLGKYEN